MSCPNYAASLSRLLDRELSASETVALERHLASCPQCRGTFEAWRRQGLVLRAFFRSHALDEAFVGRVRAAARAKRLGQPRPERAPLVTWLRYAAAVLVVIVAVSLLFQGGDSLTLARVLSPGERLEVRAEGSPRWVPAAAGAALRSGDWLREASPGAAELLLNDSSRLTLESGSVAQLRAEGSRREVVLVSGAIASEVAPDSSGLWVRTAAGTVSAAPRTIAGEAAPGEPRFGVRLRSVVLPNVELAPDASETVRGSVLLVGGVSVASGKVALQSGRTRRELTAGSSASFTSERVAAAGSPSAAASAIDARLEPVEHGSAPAALRSSLGSGANGFEITVKVEAFPVARLLEWVTDASTRALGPTRVTGTLSFPLDASASSVAAAVGQSLGLDVELRRERVVRPTARLLEPGAGAARAAPEFALRRSDDGRLSFRFRSVSAGEVFRVLRRQGVVLPALSAESEWVPLDLEARDLEPARVPDWLEKNLAMVTRNEEATILVAEVRVTRPVAEAATSEIRTAAGASAADGGELPEPAEARQGEAADTSGRDGGRDGARARLVAASAQPLLGAPKKTASGAGPFQPLVGKSVVLESRLVASEDSEVLKSLRRTRRLIWPVVGADPYGPTYYLYGPGTEPGEVTWYGYDGQGRVTVQVGIEIEGNSIVTLRPALDFGIQLASGGHWESVGESDLAGATWSGTLVGAAFDPDRLPGAWELALPGPGEPGGNGPWVLNPGAEPTRVIMAVTAPGGELVLSREIVLAAHAAWLWDGSTAELGRVPAGSMLLVQAPSGAVVAGIGDRGAALPPRAGAGEAVTLSPAKH